jgi:2-polyprenyl-3-methyl-5-hydroxy-6-metoxy-1,4-benzoquinol methylase
MSLENFNLKLFNQLNNEYSNKKLVKSPRKLDLISQKIEGEARSQKIEKIFNAHPKKISALKFLEIGCGTGNTSFAVANYLKYHVTAVDIREYPEWKMYTHSNLRFKKIDISTEDIQELGKFDLIYSQAVWEHMLHPYSALKATRQLLEDDGIFYIAANLYRGPQASHRYREVFFPWPHLLFNDEVFFDFYKSLGKKPSRAAWVNKLVVAQYLFFFQQLGFKVKDLKFQTTPIDYDFYKIFYDILSRYQRYDLEKNFIIATLSLK